MTSGKAGERSPAHAEHPQRRALQEYIAELSKLYKETSALWRRDPDPESFEWIECIECNDRTTRL